MNNFEAYGSEPVGEGTQRGWIFGYCDGESGNVEMWWIVCCGLSAERKEDEAGDMRNTFRCG